MILNQVISTFIAHAIKIKDPTTSNVFNGFAQQYINNTYGFGPECNVYFGGVSIIFPGGGKQRRDRFKNAFINYLIEHRNNRHIFNVEQTINDTLVKVPHFLLSFDRTDRVALAYIIN